MTTTARTQPDRHGRGVPGAWEGEDVMAEIPYTGDGSMPNLCAWSEQCTPAPVPKDGLTFSAWEAKNPLPPIKRDDPWRSRSQRTRFIENHVALSEAAWARLQSNEEASMWDLTFCGDPELYLDICRRRRA